MPKAISRVYAKVISETTEPGSSWTSTPEKKREYRLDAFCGSQLRKAHYRRQNAQKIPVLCHLVIPPLR